MLRAVGAMEIDFEAMGTHVTAIRKTMKSDLLIELTKGAKATAATSVIRDKLADLIARSIVTRLRHTTEVEITDLDEMTTKKEVLATILKAVRDDELPSEEEARSWSELCKAVDNDPWGLPYRVVTKKIGRQRPNVKARGKEDSIANPCSRNIQQPTGHWSPDSLKHSSILKPTSSH
ncbi:hypothetical protein QTP88_023206 [Uroleucon formosanum]